jgi:hypothetical protein
MKTTNLCGLSRMVAAGSLLLAAASSARAEPDAALALQPLRLPLEQLLAAGEGQVERYVLDGYYEPPLRFDLLLGAVVPFEESGMAFGRDTTDERFDAGVLFGLRFQGEVARNFFLGVELDFASHDAHEGEVFLRGDINRFYFLVPFTCSFPVGPVDPGFRPIRIEASVSPGFQVVMPAVDFFFERRQAFLGRFIDERDFVAFNLRAAVSARFPISPFSEFFVETSYDWAAGFAEVLIRNAAGTVIERRAGDVDLSALNALAGFAFRF